MSRSKLFVVEMSSLLKQRKLQRTKKKYQIYFWKIFNIFAGMKFNFTVKGLRLSILFYLSFFSDNDILYALPTRSVPKRTVDYQQINFILSRILLLKSIYIDETFFRFSCNYFLNISLHFIIIFTATFYVRMRSTESIVADFLRMDAFFVIK